MEISQDTKQQLRCSLATAVLIYLFFSAIHAFVQFSSPNILDIDGYYHIKVAYLIRTEGFLENFPWAQLSTWRDNYFDKDLLFHLFLIPFTFGDLIFGAKLATTLISSLFFVVLFWVLTKEKIPYRFFYLTLPLCIGLGHYFYRLQFPRGQIVVGTFLLLCLYFLLNRKPKHLAVAMFLFTLSYGSSFLIIGISGLFVLTNLVKREALGLDLLLASVIGFSLASLIHPNFPQNVSFLFTQMVQALTTGSDVHPGLQAAGELEPYYYHRWAELFWRFPFWTFALCACAFSDIKFSNKLTCLFLCCLVFFGLTFRYARGIETFAPLLIYFLALLFTELYRERLFIFSFFKRENQKWNIWSKAVIIFASLFALSYASLSTYIQREVVARHAYDYSIENAAKWLSKNTPHETTVFTCGYSITHPLFFYNHNNFYTNAADPIFFYKYDPLLFDIQYRMLNGETKELTPIFRNHLKMKWGICSTSYGEFLNQVRVSDDFEIPYDDGRYVIFRLKGE